MKTSHASPDGHAVQWFVPLLPDALAQDRYAHLLIARTPGRLGRRDAACGTHHRIWIPLDHEPAGAAIQRCTDCITTQHASQHPGDQRSRARTR